MATTSKIKIDASALASIDFESYIASYFAALTSVGSSTYYDGEVVNSIYGPQYVKGDQVGFRYTTTPTNDAQVLMEGTDIAYNFLTYGTNHGFPVRSTASRSVPTTPTRPIRRPARRAPR
ncbi:hypothetical protein LXM94_02880 [Rhizobium sp. TRM95111]|uniref:hypothetical protein n=1 Tax=Rhizobium alarense TaxID=2846851 RepID=UPI001F1C455C|nr:hypothetical protein [Rhizobium alarense]MCF3638913.1 hypothetical protein [Rhizobium alarense]